jgi:zinc protease
MPRFRQVDVADGIRLAYLRRARTPLAHLLCALPVGAAADPDGLEGMANMLLPLLKAGTARRRGDQLAAATRSLGAEILAWSGWESGIVSIELRSRDAETAIDLLTEMVVEPTFPDDALERLRRRQRAFLARQRWQSDRLADAWLARTLYGQTPYGRSLAGSEESVERVRRHHLVAMHRELVTEGALDIVAVGDVAPDLLRERVRALAGGRRSPPSACAVPPVGAPAERALRIVDLPMAAHAELRVGQVGLSRKHPDFHYLRLVAHLLTRRLMAALREARGLTYRVECTLAARVGQGPLAVSTVVPPQHARDAVLIVLDAMRRLREEDVSEIELVAAKQWYVGTFLRSCRTLQQLAIKIKQLAAAGLPHDFFDRQIDEVRALEAPTLRELAAEHLDPERAVVVAVGPGRELEQSFAPLAAGAAAGGTVA